MRFAAVLRAAGCSLVALALLVNPWVGVLYRDGVVNYADVMRQFLFFGVAAGSLLLLLSRWVAAGAGEARVNLSLLALVAVVLAAADRLVLVWLGLSAWVVDPDLHYRYRPNITRSWGPDNPTVSQYRTETRFADRLYSTNRYGHNDDEFPEAKPPRELRGVLLGDSIVMGYKVATANTHAQRLESLLRRFDERHASHQVINAGVEGYSTSQERKVLERALRFAPDFAVVGFCMNDITNPYADGAESAPHLQIARWAGVGGGHYAFRYLLNETGFGRLVQKVRSAAAPVDRWRIEARVLASASADDPAVREAWAVTLGELERIYELCRRNGIPVLLAVFPDLDQLFRPDRQKPQQILAAHARGHGVGMVDYAPMFEGLVRGYLAAAEPRGAAPDDMKCVYDLLASRLLIDHHHLTNEGHRIVALNLLSWLRAEGLVEVAGADLQRAMGEREEQPVHYYITSDADEMDCLVRALDYIGDADAARRVRASVAGLR